MYSHHYPFGLTTAASARHAAIQKNAFGSSTTALIILNKEIQRLCKIVKSFEK